MTRCLIIKTLTTHLVRNRDCFFASPFNDYYYLHKTE